MLIGHVPSSASRFPGMCTSCDIPWGRGCKESRQRWQATYPEAGRSVLVMTCQLFSVIWGSYEDPTPAAPCDCNCLPILKNVLGCIWDQSNAYKFSQSFASVEPIPLRMGIKSGICTHIYIVYIYICIYMRPNTFTNTYIYTYITIFIL